MKTLKEHGKQVGDFMVREKALDAEYCIDVLESAAHVVHYRIKVHCVTLLTMQMQLSRVEALIRPSNLLL